MIPGIVASGQNFPLSLGPALWLDAADTSTITASGGAVSQWNDKSGNGRNFTQATAALQPATGTRTINSLNVLDFDGGDRLFRADDAGMRPSSFTTFIVMVSDTLSGRRVMFMGGSASTYPTNNYSFETNNTTQNFQPRTPTASLTAGALSTGVTYLLQYRHNGSTLNGAINTTPSYSNVTSTIGTDNTTGNCVGASNLSLFFFDGGIGEVLFYPAVLSADSIVQVEAYLSAKWGI